ncbi:MAG: hypothetical protein EPO21_14015 [Chloroflexota bacterium]|nr:MAG: hypothetical protein EPO21_14015 [Chloroflexota bacterium]
MLKVNCCGEVLERAMTTYSYGSGAMLVKDSDGGGFSLAAHAGVPNAPIELLSLLAGTAIPTEASSGRVLVFRQRQQVDATLRRVSVCLGGGDMVVVPMMSRGEMVGVMLLGNRMARGRVGPTEKAGLLTAGAIAALAQERSWAEQKLATMNMARRVHSAVEPGERLDQLDQHHTGFTSLISHQLRTPLTSIRGYAQLLLRQASPDAAVVHQYAAVIVEKSGHLIDTIEEVRGLAEVTSDLLGLRQEPLHVVALTRQVVASMQPFSRNPLVTCFASETTLVKADHEKISKVVSSFVCNAMRRSSSTWPIRIGTELTPGGLAVWVGDRGARLSQQEAETAFEWGRPSDDGIDDAGVRANALALYAASRIVQAHGGRVWVESDDDETRFCFELPS